MIFTLDSAVMRLKFLRYAHVVLAIFCWVPYEVRELVWKRKMKNNQLWCPRRFNCYPAIQPILSSQHAQKRSSCCRLIFSVYCELVIEYFCVLRIKCTACVAYKLKCPNYKNLELCCFAVRFPAQISKNYINK